MLRILRKMEDTTGVVSQRTDNKMVKREGQTDKKLSETLKTNDWATRTSYYC
jgi:hypothetical protein